jgi:hypothetical protein
MDWDPRTFSELAGRGVPTPEIIERRRYYEALSPETC